MPSKLCSNAYSLTIEPNNGVIKKHKQVEINTTVEVFQGNCNLKELLSIDVKGGKRVPIIIRINAEKAVFGVPLEDLELVKVYKCEVYFKL